MNKHTPGPWELEANMDGLCKRPEEWGATTQVVSFANPEDPIYVGFTLKENDAHLMAAAPKLLRELERLEWTKYNGTIYCQTCGNHKEIGHMDGCTLAAAIAKAKGG